MHMADALISPAVGGTMWAVTAGLLAFCARRVRETLRDNLVSLMGVLGAFIFAAQMTNFTIPGTGSSGHLGGGLILAVLLGPHAAFLVIASVLTVQAFFFADGGLLALGCNIFNLGFFPAFIAYPLIYRPLARGEYATTRSWLAALLAAVVGLQLGAFSVVLETVASGISDLSFRAFVLLMQPIHLAIGIVEGLATAAVVTFVARARPEVLPTAPAGLPAASLRPLLVGLALAAALVGGTLSWFASAHPDGLEWALARTTGQEEVAGPEDGIHGGLARVQEKTALLPDYGFKSGESQEGGASEQTWPAIQPGTSVAGLVGGALTLGLAFLAGFLLKRRGAPAT